MTNSNNCKIFTNIRTYKYCIYMDSSGYGWFTNIPWIFRDDEIPNSRRQDFQGSTGFHRRSFHKAQTEFPLAALHVPWWPMGPGWGAPIGGASPLKGGLDLP